MPVANESNIRSFSKRTRKRVTLKDIAIEAGVSTVTVSHVLLKSRSQTVRVSESTAAIVRKIAKKMDYKPNNIARQLAGRKSKMIGVIIDADSPDLYRKMLSVMEAYASEKGYRFIIGQAHDDSDRLAGYIDDFESRAVQGLIVFSHSYNKGSGCLADKLSYFKNVVFINEPGYVYKNSHYVQIDYLQSTKKTLSYLKSNGRKTNALFLYSSGHPSEVKREQSYYEVCEELGLFGSSELVYKMSHEDVSGEKLKDIVKHCAMVQKVDSIIASNDKMAAMVIKALQNLGIKVPADVGVIGYDNLDWGDLLEPDLTTIDPKPDELAKAAMDIMFELLSTTENSKQYKVLIEPELILRSSV